VSGPTYLVITMDDDHKGHPTFCPNEDAVRDVVRDAMFMPGELDADEQECVRQNAAALIESGAIHFEGDPSIHLYQMAELRGPTLTNTPPPALPVGVESLTQALTWALAWIDAVPKDTPLPTMPGFDRDYVNDLLERARTAMYADDGCDDAWQAMRAAAARRVTPAPVEGASGFEVTVHKTGEPWEKQWGGTLTFKRYLALKYDQTVPSVCTAAEAKAFGFRYPLKPGWLDEHGHKPMNEDRAKRILASLESKSARTKASPENNERAIGVLRRFLKEIAA
jgi:hypothetical protein